MTAYYDYPYRGRLAAAQYRAMLDEIDQLRGWKESAMTELLEWDAVWETAGRPGPLGGSRAHSTRDEIDRLRTALAAWSTLHDLY